MSANFVEQRRAEILSTLKKHGQASVTELADRFFVSQLTIRRDLDHLADQGLVVRSYGLARLAKPNMGDGNIQDSFARSAISKYAARLVESGDTLFVNTSTTALGIFEHISAEGVTIITNSGRALNATLPPSSTVLLTGGEIRVPKWSMTGDFALANIAQIRADKCFMGCSGLSVRRGITTNVAQEMRVNSLMLERSSHTVLLADSSKIENDSNFSYGALDQINVLVTDDRISENDCRRLSDAGVGEIIRVTL